MLIELNPCVKCGGKPIRENGRKDERENDFWTMARVYFCTCGKCGKFEYGYSRKESDAAWNAANPKEAEPNAR